MILEVMDRELIEKGFEPLRGIKALVVGLGRSGLSALSLLREAGAYVYATDRAVPSPLPEGVELVPYGEVPGGTELVVSSPGVAPEEEVLRKAKRKGIELIGELELTYRVLESLGIPWIAVTGTNGKSTTTSLIDFMLRLSGLKVVTGGNIGEAIGQKVLPLIRDGSILSTDYIVAEVSSFQLETIERFRPQIALVLNITPDHLDRYNSMDEYIEAKRAITKNQKEQDWIILNQDDPIVRGFSDDSPARALYFSIKEQTTGGYLREGSLYISINDREVELVSADAMPIKGAHNVENALAASLATYIVTAEPEPIRKALRQFRGLEHRMELVAVKNGVTYINDSKGTNVGAVVKSLEGLTGWVVLILGGRDKGGDFSPLRRFKDRIRRVIAIGEAKTKIRRSLGDSLVIEDAEDMFDAVKKASGVALRGDTVLLSPGCASFDMFRSFEHRGEVFKEAVKRLEKNE
ncbi:MAG: UDP-N-acetylmuramoyl-L-alanine--D-glutamate ligase [Nitrospirae bacterium]|nr:MAG: UDP-N-acetylmuramoyl-L-alanine--D-glutamate ligase [Nitrospirota bacterium]